MDFYLFGEEKGTKIGNALDIAFIEHIDHFADGEATGLAWGVGDNKADSAQAFWFALTSNLFGDHL